MRMVAAIAIFVLLGSPVLGEGRMTVQPGFGATPPMSGEQFGKAPPLPKPRPNPHKWNPEWRGMLERGEDIGPEFEAWFAEQHRMDMRNPEYRKMYQEELKKAEEFKKRYEGWMREAQRALQPGHDI